MGGWMKMKRGLCWKGLSIRALALASSFIIGTALYGFWIGAPFRTRPATLRATIIEAIEMLERRDYETFLKRYPDPQDMRKIIKRSAYENSLDSVKATFDDRKATILLRALKKIRDQEPLYNEDQSEATFLLDERVFRHGSIAFRRIDDIWYIRDRSPHAVD
jgi:hypothetical protein